VGRARGRSRFTSPSFLFLCQLLSGAALVGVWLAVTVVISLIAAIGYVAVTGPGTPKVTRHHPAKEPPREHGNQHQHAPGTERPRPGGQRLEKRTRTLPGSAAAAAGCLVQGTGPEPVVSPSRRVHGPRKGGLPRLPRPGRVPGLGSASR
jgi:hypothetical protein